MMSFNSAMDNLIAISAGLVYGAKLIHKVGRNSAIPNGSWSLVNEVGANNWQIPAPQTFNIKAGGNVNDTALGSGAREINLFGLDQDGVYIETTLATSGASASAATSITLCRLFDCVVSKSGTRYQANTGDIILETGGNEVLHIEATEGKAEIGTYSIGLGQEGYLLSVNVNVAANKSANIRGFCVEEMTNSTSPYKGRQQIFFIDELEGFISESRHSPIEAFPELTDLWFEAYGNGNQTAVDVDFELLILDK